MSYFTAASIEITNNRAAKIYHHEIGIRTILLNWDYGVSGFFTIFTPLYYVRPMPFGTLYYWKVKILVDIVFCIQILKVMQEYFLVVEFFYHIRVQWFDERFWVAELIIQGKFEIRFLMVPLYHLKIGFKQLSLRISKTRSNNLLKDQRYILWESEAFGLNQRCWCFCDSFSHHPTI